MRAGGSSLAIAATLFLAAAAPGSSHVGDLVIPVFQLSDARAATLDVGDGSVLDWVEAVGNASLTTLDFEALGFNGPLALDPADLEFRIWLGWHETTSRLFVALERADDDYVNDFTRGEGPPFGLMTAWDGNIIVEVDGDHSGGQWLPAAADPEERRLLWHRQAQSFIALAETFDSQSQVDLFPPPGYGIDQFFLAPPFADGGGGVTGSDPTLTVTEFYATPFDRLVWNSPGESEASVLFARKAIGLNISVIDADRPDEVDFYVLRTTSDLGRGDADNFHDAILLAPLPRDDSAVAANSWGRIKASLTR